MKFKKVWVVGLALLLIGSIGGCGYYTQYDVDEAYEAGHAEGYDAGAHAGYIVGYELGHEYGFTEGENAGLAELESATEEAEKVGYDKGYEDGFREGYSATQTEQNESQFFLEIVSITTPVSPGYYATLEARTVPNTICGIDVYYASGKSEAQGLYAQRADSEGNVSWTWKVGTRTTPGWWRIVVTAFNVDDWFSEMPIISEEAYFEVR